MKERKRARRFLSKDKFTPGEGEPNPNWLPPIDDETGEIATEFFPPGKRVELGNRGLTPDGVVLAESETLEESVEVFQERVGR